MSYTFTVFLATMSVTLVVLVVCLMYTTTVKNKNKIAENSIFLTNKKTGFSKWIMLYATFDNFAPTSKFLRRIYEQYAVIAPDDEKFSKERSIKTAMFLWVLSLASLLILVIMKPTLYLFLILSLTVFAASAQYVYKKLEKCNNMLLNQFITLLVEVRAAFFRHGMVDEAIYEAIPELPRLIQGHALKMYKVLTSDDPEEELVMYNETTMNVYLKRFVSICATAMKYGDSEIDGQSVFVNNIKNLQNDVYAYMRRKRDESHKFSFLVTITLAPAYTLMFIQKWAISSVAELEPFYKGRGGILCTAATFAITFICYNKVIALRSPKMSDTTEHPFLQYLENRSIIANMIRNYEARNYGKMMSIRDLLRRTGSSLTSRQFILQGLCRALACAVCAVVVFAGAEVATRKQAVTVFTDMTDKSMNATEEVNVLITALTIHFTEMLKDVNLDQWYEEYTGLSLNSAENRDEELRSAMTQWLMSMMLENGIEVDESVIMRGITTYNSQHADNTTLPTLAYGTTGVLDSTLDDRSIRKAQNKLAEFCEAVQGKNCLGIETNYEAVASGVIEHVGDYQNAYFKWYYLLIAYGIAVIVYYSQLYSIKANEKELQLFMKDEVIQLESILLALKPVARISQYELLENMVTFSVVFKDSLQKCLNNVDSDEMAAYEQLLDDEPFYPFQRIVKNLMAVDRIGVQGAFNDLEVEIKNATEEFNQDSAIRLSERGATALNVSYMPLFFVLAGYMCVPFMIKSMEKLAASLQMING